MSIRAMVQQGCCQLFSLLEDVIESKKLDVERIWNCEETGISAIPKLQNLSEIYLCQREEAG